MVTVILTMWKRKHIEEQLKALQLQTYKPDAIWIYHCCSFIKPKFKLIQKYDNVKYQYNSNNLGYFGRFSLGLHAKTPYLYIIDDDVIPSNNWIANCIDLCSSNNAIISSSGRIIPFNDYQPEVIKDNNYLSRFFVGDNDNESITNTCDRDTVIDFGCNSWFFKTEWLNYFWSINPYTFDTGEDIHLSASCLLKGGIATICPRQEESDLCGNLKKYYGFDNLASWRDGQFITKRENLLKYLIDECGWKPVKWR